MYLIDGLKSVADYLADKSDSEDNAEAEAILSRFLAQIEEEFRADEDDDYLRLAQLLDPIRKILGTNAASTSCERTFNYGGIVLNCRRTSLLTDMADKLIVSACRHKNTLRAKLKLVKLPDIGVLDIDVTTVEEAAEHAEATEESWDELFGEF